MAAGFSLFIQHVQAILDRWCVQNNIVIPPGESAGVAQRLAGLVGERRAGPAGPGGFFSSEMSDPEAAPFVAAMLAEIPVPRRELLMTPARQLVKACFNPLRTRCRDSFRERGSDGSCRRQELPRVRSRVSGSHCIDCPYFTELPEEPHREFLRECWDPAKRDELAAHWEIFLPEDFRALRIWIEDITPPRLYA